MHNYSASLQTRKQVAIAFIGSFLWVLGGIWAYDTFSTHTAVEATSQPVKAAQLEATLTASPTITIRKGKSASFKVHVGLASYYSRQGCLGCSSTLTMANGEQLNDDKLTVAYNHAPLNSMVKIGNLSNGKTVLAKVTDTGGFERHGRIVDLSVATRDAIGCSNLCEVEVIKI